VVGQPVTTSKGPDGRVYKGEVSNGLVEQMGGEERGETVGDVQWKRSGTNRLGGVCIRGGLGLLGGGGTAVHRVPETIDKSRA